MRNKFFILNQHSILINDYRWYAKKQDQIDKWCYETYQYLPRTGMILSFRTKQDMTFFILRWD